MTLPAKKDAPKEGAVPRIGRERSLLERLQAWLKTYATLILIVIAATAFLWHTITARIDDTRTEVGKVETRVTREIGKVEARVTSEIGKVETRLSNEAGKSEARLGKRIDDLRVEIREARQERSDDMNSLRQDIQGLRQDVWMRAQPEIVESPDG